MASARYTKQAPAKFAQTHNYNKVPTFYEHHSLQHQEDEVPPPRKDKKKQEKQKKKKRTYDETAHSARNGAADSSMGKITAGASESNAIAIDDEEDAEDEEEDADDGRDRSRRPKKKLKRQGTVSKPTSTNNSPRIASSNGPSRLILRLPNNNPSLSKHAKTDKSRKMKHNSPSRLNARHPGSHARTVTTSPVSSLSSDHAKRGLDVIPDFSLAPAGFQLTYASDSSDEFSDLIEDDEDDLEGAEEAYLIADKLKKMERKARKGTHSPNLTQSHGSDNESMEVIGATRDAPQANGESVLFEIARIRRMSDDSTRSDVEQDGPVTWSGAEDSDLDNLDELLGLTTDDTAALIGNLPEESEDGKTIRFEDFLAADDGDASDSSAGDSGDSDETSSGDEDELNLPDTDMDNEHISTTQEMMQHGGFVFYKAGPDDSTEDELSEDLPSGGEDDGGDTTDTLDDTDHLGLVRFGIEAVDEDDEDAEEALQTAMMDRNLSDARNMGLSISIEALAEQPEMVVAKTAKSLGVSAETAAKILTSVGMSILMNGGHPIASDGEKEESKKRKDNKGKGRSHLAPPVPGSGPLSAGLKTATGPPSKEPESSVPTASTSAVPASQPVDEQPKKHEPVLGDFEPAGEADLCVVVAQSSMPAPSPFSARKRRRPRTFTNGSPSAGSGRRGQSVVSSLSSQSFTSALPYHSNSSEEPHYNIILDLDDLVDPSMLPGGMTDVSEEDEEIDDTASMSTASANIASGQAAVGDTSRWNRVPIGAFRSANPQATQYSPLATAFFSGTRDAAVANNLSFHGGVAITTKQRKNRYIPVSPVLFPVAQSLKSISHAKSRKERRHDKKQKKIKREEIEAGLTASNNPTFPSTSTSTQGAQSLPSDGLLNFVSPLFSGIASGVHIPPLSLGEPHLHD